MKRLAAVLATVVVLGSGCGRDCIATVVVDWSGGFQAFDGAILDCTGGAVQAVDIFVNDQFDSTWACGTGAARAGLFDGGNIVTVEGIDAGNNIVFRAEFTVNGGSCGEQRVAVSPAEGTVDVQYAFSPVDACSTLPSYMFFSVFDEIAGQVAAQVDETNFDPIQDACSVPPALTFVLPAGSYTLDGIEESGPAPFPNTLANDCTQRPFTIAGASTTTLFPVLFDSPDPNARCF